MSKEVLKCCYRPGYKCSAPLHGEITILSCEKNCRLGCAEPVKRGKKR